MKVIFVTLLLVFAAVAQVSVAPLFSVSGAVTDLGLLTLLLLAVFAGPRTVMVGMPLFAICLGFATDRSPALLILAYLPLLPLARFLEESSVPMTRYWQAAIACLATGVWARWVLIVGAVAGGASLAPGPIVFQVLLPGVMLDWVLFTVVYFPFRLVGWQAHGMSLQRSSYFS